MNRILVGLTLLSIAANVWGREAPLGADDTEISKLLRAKGGEITESKGVITALTFKDASKLSDAEFERITRLRHLKLLSLSNGLDDARLAQLANLAELEYLQTNLAQITDDGVKPLVKLKNLKNLKFFHPGKSFTGAGLAHLAGMPNLERLTVAGSLQFNDDGMAAVAKITRLKEFRTWHAGGTDEGVKKLKELKNLKSLYLGQRLTYKPPACPTDETIAILAEMKSLESLQLDEARLTYAALRQLKQLPALQKLTLGGVDIGKEDVERLRQELPMAKIEWSAPNEVYQRRIRVLFGEERTPRQVAEQLAAVYGQKLNQVAYIPALPLVAKLRLSELTSDPKYAEQVHTIVAPYLRGEKTPIPKSGSEQAGHLIFSELAARAKGKDRERWTLLCRNAADQIFDKDGKALPLMPFHNEMSDAVFMAGPILAATGNLTGERKYFDAAAGHFASMRKLCLRADGIYRHSPLCEAAWGRGNGFPALGLALALSNWPEDHPARKELIAEFQKHMAALKPHQDAKSGCWHQVIDHPESYDEYSCTCMIGFAMQRGIARGWLAKSDYQPSVDRAWRAIKERTSADGKLVNVCTGTGKQKTLQDYFKRPAINGRDDRGGAMGMLFATELMAVGHTADDRLVYITSFAGGGKGAINAFRLDAAGKLSPMHKTDIDNPFYLAVSPNEKFVYAINARQFGSKEDEQVAAYQIVGTSGELKPLNRQSARGSAACYLDVDATGKTVLVANYTSGSVAALPVKADGSLGEAASYFQHAGSSVDPARQKGPHAHCIVVSPDNRFAFAADLGLDQVLCYRLDPATAKLTPNQPPFAKSPPGAGPRHLTFHPSGKTVYVINELKNSVTVFAYDAKAGTLTERQTISTLPKDFAGKSYCADVKVTPNGRFLYGTNRGHDSIAAYRIADDGTLTLLGIEPSLGRGPQNLAITRDGKLLLCANMPGNNVAVFRLDAESGKMTSVGLPTGVLSPSCIRILSKPGTLTP